MRFPEWLKVYGDTDFRGKCPPEWNEQVDGFAWMQYHHPELSALAVHPKNEGKRTWGQAARDKKDGSINKGASDCIIPGLVGFACEIKRADHTKSKWQEGQLDYLKACHDQGGFACVALGAEGFKLAITDYLKGLKNG